MTKKKIYIRVKFLEVTIVVFSLLLFPGIAETVFAEVTETDNQLPELSEIDLMDLLKVEVVSASKKMEDLFDSPLSASVITRREIENTGATSIMEALRLVPGVIVREQSPGNYDIHIRGFDNVPPNLYLPLSANTLSLVMIDNRIVYNYINGGIFWESLPIDINDVERIEVIRGPASALYGPNAVTGVINIITRKPKQNGFYSVANFQKGTHRSSIANGTIGYKKEKFTVLFSANYNERERMQTSYFDYTTQSYVDWRELHSDVGQLMEDSDYVYGDDSTSMKKYGFNGFFSYSFGESVHLGVSGGYQDSTSRKAFLGNLISPLLLHKSKTSYVDVDLKLRSFQTKVFFLTGNQEFPGANRFDSDLDHLNVIADYNFTGQNYNIRAGVSYTKITYYGSFVLDKGTLESAALSLRADFTPSPKLRLVAAVRGDKYTHQDNPIYTYQFAATYTINEKKLVRAVFSRANRSPFMADTYNYLNGRFYGNPDLKPVYIDMVELGYRAMISRQLQLDIEAAYSISQNYSAVSRGDGTGVLMFYNIPTKAYQEIFTFTLNYSPSSKFNAKLFASFQRTELKNFVPNIYDLTVTENMRHTNTPELYGGASINFKPVRRMNINANTYYYTSQVQDLRDLPFFDQKTDISGKIIFNMKVSYKIAEPISVYFNARNLFNNDSIEFGFSDSIKSTFLVGISYDGN